MPEVSLEEIQRRLSEPFSEDEIEWRVMRSFTARSGKKYAFVAAYVESRAIMNRLDTVMGIGNWENDFRELHNGILCGIKIHLPNGKTVTKYDGADLTAFEATKGGISGAFKRAAVHFGIGRYLYNLQEEMVQIFPNKNQGKIYMRDNKSKIEGYWNPPQLPDWALPSRNSGNVSQQQPVTNPNISSKQEKDPRTEVQKYINEFEKVIGISNNPQLIIRNFNKANKLQIDALNYVRNASLKELTAYYKALKPIYQLQRIKLKYNFEETQFLNLVQTYLVNIKVTSLQRCFFNVSDKQVKQVEELAKATYFQKQQVS